MHPTSFICRSYDVFLLYPVSCYFKTKFQECYVISLHFHSFSKVLCRGKSLLRNMASNMIWIPFCVTSCRIVPNNAGVHNKGSNSSAYEYIYINTDTLHHRHFHYYMVGITFSCVFSCVLGANCRGCKISSCWMMQIKELDCTVLSWYWYSIRFLSDDYDDVMI